MCIRDSLKAALSANRLFAGLGSDYLAQLSPHFVEKTYPVGNYVFQQWDAPNRLYIVLSGKLSIETHGPDGKIITLGVLGPEDVFGEFALIDKRPRSASVIVTESARLGSISKMTFDQLIMEHPIILKNMLNLLVGHLRTSNDQIESLVNLTLMQRTAKLIHTMSVNDAQEIKITQKALSERLYASREKVNTKLKELDSMGAITRGRGRITVLSKEALLSVLETP